MVSICIDAHAQTHTPCITSVCDKNLLPQDAAVPVITLKVDTLLCVSMRVYVRVCARVFCVRMWVIACVCMYMCVCLLVCVQVSM